MPLAGIGPAPGAGATFNELAAVTRRAFVPRLIVQTYFASPNLFYLMGNAQRAAGGLNQVTIPMQGNSMVQGQFTNYGGGFNNPIITPGIQNGQFNLAYWVVPVPLPFGETILQVTDRVISLLKARMNDVYAVTWQQLSRLAFLNNSSNVALPNSYYDAFDDGTNVASYGGINRNASGNANFKGQYINLGAAPWNASGLFSANATRKGMAGLLTKVTDAAGGEPPTYGVMSPGDFAQLNNDIVGIESQYVQPSREYSIESPVRSSFPNINISGIPIFADHFCPSGDIFFINSKYTQMYLSEDAAFDFSGFYSLVPLGQIGQQGVMVLGYNIISGKSSSGAFCYNLPGALF